MQRKQTAEQAAARAREILGEAFTVRVTGAFRFLGFVLNPSASRSDAIGSDLTSLVMSQKLSKP